MTSDSESSHHHEHFSPWLFFATVILTVAGICLVMLMVAPGTWQAQLSASAWAFFGAFLAISLVNAFFEYFLHRYVLHRPAIPLLGRFYRQHTLHHALTRIARRPSRDGRGLLFVENKFPIEEPEQGEGSFFPWYTLAVFFAVLLPLFALLNWLAPAVPWFLGGLAALTFSLILYELLHAINHWPLDRWLPLIEHRRWGWFWRPVYSFHLRHHAVIDCNESISGFFGLPVADWLFRTCVIPPTIYADGEEWKSENFTAPRPRALIRWLDRLSESVVTARREAAAQASSRSEPAAGDSPGERLANWLTHGIGAVLSVAGLTLLVVIASLHGDVWHVVSFSVFGVSLVALYTSSAIYHLTTSESRKAWFRRIDHAAIFVLIAGTYTPFLLTELRGPWGWSLFGVVWGLCAAGAVFKFVSGARARTTSVVIYLFAGWLILVAAKPMLDQLPPAALWLLVAGGLCYTAGVPFYLWRKLRYHHAYWHSFVLGGSACHFLAVVFLLPSQGA